MADVVAVPVLDPELLGKRHRGELDLARRDARRHDLDCACLQREHGGERALLLGRGIADDHRPFQLAVIPVDVRPRAADKDVALLDAVALDEAVGHGR